MEGYRSYTMKLEVFTEERRSEFKKYGFHGLKAMILEVSFLVIGHGEFWTIENAGDVLEKKYNESSFQFFKRDFPTVESAFEYWRVNFK